MGHEGEGGLTVSLAPKFKREREKEVLASIHRKRGGRREGKYQRGDSFITLLIINNRRGKVDRATETA